MLNKTSSSFFVVLVLSLVGCAVPLKGPSHEEVVKQALPEMLEPGLQWSQMNPLGSVKDGWLATFEDEKLEQLIDEVLQNNPELAIARANLESAESVANQAGAQLLPDVNVGVGAQSTTRGSNTSTGTGVSLNMQWELDLWGKLKASSMAAEEAFRATQANFEFTRQSLVAQTAKAWYSAIEAKIQEHLSEHAVKIYQNLLYIVRVQVDVGQAQQQDVYLVKG